MQRESRNGQSTGAPASERGPSPERQPHGTLAIIGAGWLGETLLRRWLARGVPSARLVATHRRADRCERLSRALGIEAWTDNRRGAATGDTIVLGVRPHEVRGVLERTRDLLDARTTVVSLAAALDLATLRQWLGPAPALCRALFPPTIATGGGPVFVTTDTPPDDPRKRACDAWLDALGSRVVHVDDAVADALLVGVGGLAPHAALMLDALAGWLAARGVPRPAARELLLEALTGVAAQFAADRDFAAGLEHAPTPGGLTEAAFLALEKGDVRRDLAASLDAMLARASCIRTECVAKTDATA